MFSLKHFLVVCCTALVLAACGPDDAPSIVQEPAPPAGGDGGTGNQPPSTAILTCLQESYPCSYDAVPLAVIQRSVALGQEIAQQLRDGSPIEQAAAQLGSQGDMAEVFVDGQVLSFRLAGGRPVIVDVTGRQEMLAGPPPGTSTLLSPVRQALASASKPRALRAAPAAKIVGGGNKAQRRALVLSPFRYEADFGNAGEMIAGALDTVRGYTGNVSYLATTDDTVDPGVTIDALANLGAYDVIHIDTHGGTLCKLKNPGGGDCALSSTDFLVQRFQGTAEDLQNIEHPGVVHYIGRTHESLAVTPDFFRHYYPNGIGEKLFVLASCNTFRADMASAIAGNTGVFVSWDGYTDYSLVLSYGLALMNGLGSGLTVGESFARLPDYNSENPDATGTLRYSERKVGGDLRIRDLISVRDNLTGLAVTSLSGIEVRETPGDGVNDNLDLEFTVDGITPEQLANFNLRLRIEGHDIGYISLAQSGELSGDFSYLVSTPVPLPFDVLEGQALDMDFWIELPDQGEDHFVAAPRVNERELGTRWVLQSTLTHDTTTIISTVHFEIDSDDDPSGNFHYFYVRSGTVRVLRSFEGADDCIYHVDHTVQLAEGASDNWLAFGTNGNATVVTGYGRIPSEIIEVSACGNPLSVNVGGVYFLNSETVVTGDLVQGVYSNGAQIPTIVEWSLTKES